MLTPAGIPVKLLLLPHVRMVLKLRRCAGCPWHSGGGRGGGGEGSTRPVLAVGYTAVALLVVHGRLLLLNIVRHVLLPVVVVMMLVVVLVLKLPALFLHAVGVWTHDLHQLDDAPRAGAWLTHPPPEGRIALCPAQRAAVRGLLLLLLLRGRLLLLPKHVEGRPLLLVPLVLSSARHEVEDPAVYGVILACLIPLPHKGEPYAWSAARVQRGARMPLDGPHSTGGGA